MTQYRIIVDGKEFLPRLIERTHTAVRFELNGTVHEVSVAPCPNSSRERSAPLANAVTAPQHATPVSAQLADELRTPMPGVVVSIAAKPGDAVSRGDTLVVVEAMKMENNIASPRDGTIKSIHVQAGQELEPNALLISFS